MQLLINDFITLFVALDPLGTVPLLVGLIGHLSRAEQRRIILRAGIIASCVLSGFAIFGHVLLASMGISFAAFRVAGGIVLFIVGSRMVFENEADEPATKAGHKEVGRDVAVFPLAMPYLAGPATTLAVMVSTQQQQFEPVTLLAKIAVLGLVMICSIAILLSATQIQRVIGRTGSAIIGRVMGILLAALAAESVLRGIQEAFKI